jgi:hypothetical protein
MSKRKANRSKRSPPLPRPLPVEDLSGGRMGLTDTQCQNVRNEVVGAAQIEERARRWGSLPKLLKLFCILFISSVVVGYFTGRALSPKYEDQPTFERYVVDHLDKGSDLTWLVTDLPGSDLVMSLGPVAGTLEFPCHCRTFGYDIRNGGKLEPWPSDGGCMGESSEVQRHGLEFKDTLAVLISGLEGYSVKVAITESRNYWVATAMKSTWRRAQTLLASFVAVVSGVALGFHLGYREIPDCEALKDELSGKDFWKDVGSRWVQEHTWRINYDRPSIAAADRNDIWRWRSGKEPRPVVITGITNKRKFFTLSDVWRDMKDAELVNILPQQNYYELTSPDLRRQLIENEHLRSGSLLTLLLGIRR